MGNNDIEKGTEGPPETALIQSKPSRRSRIVGLIAFTALAVGLAVGLSVPFKNNSRAEESKVADSGGNFYNESTASTDNSTTAKPNSTTTIPFVAGLEAISTKNLRIKYDSCSDLKTDLVEATAMLADVTIEQNVKWFFHNNYGDEVFDVAFADAPAAEAMVGSGDFSKSTSTEDSFGTNNQVQGVDEADLVKSNGMQVFMAYGSDIVEMDADEVEVLSRTSLPEESDSSKSCKFGTIRGMLLIDEHLVVITDKCHNYFYPSRPIDEPFIVVDEVDGEPLEEFEDGQAEDENTIDIVPEDLDFKEDPDDVISSIVTGQGSTQVLIYDTTTMELVSSESLQGDYISARSIQDSVHIVTTSYLDVYQGFTRYLDPDYFAADLGSNFTEEMYRTMAAEAAEQRTDSFVEKLAEELDCTSTQKISLMSNQKKRLDFSTPFQSMSSVHSFSSKDLPGTLSSTNMVLHTSYVQVYSSENRLVLATNGFWIEASEDSEESAEEETFLITYRLDGASATPVGLGVAKGYLLNQFSLDHVKQGDIDYLRVATSTSNSWMLDDEGSWVQADESTSQVTILEINEDTEDMMPVAGKVEGLGKPGEQIFSVRFQGDRGFVVTFRRTDPFYTLDLSDPTDPIKVGELEIPGFSNYLHPIGDLILGVGEDVDPETERSNGLQISLFDVTDFANPTRIQNYVAATDSNSFSSSEAQYDHKAFRYLEESKILILPISKYGEQDAFDGFELFEVSEDGIVPYFSIEHGSDYWTGCYSASYLPSRSLVFGGDVMTIKGHSVLSHDLTTKLADADVVNLDEGKTEDCQTYFIDFMF